MSKDLMHEFIQCLVDSAKTHAGTTGDRDGYVLRAHEISKKLSKKEYREAVKLSVIRLLENKFPHIAISWLEFIPDFIDLKKDMDVQRAFMEYLDFAKSKGYDNTQEVEDFFK